MDRSMSRYLTIPTQLDDAAIVDLATRAFDDGEPEALETAHRALYAIYAERIWRAPDAPRPPDEQHTIDRLRGEFECGFRAQLDRHREPHDAALEPPAPEDTADWLEQLALGDHPDEDGSWGEYVSQTASLDAMKRIVLQRSLFFLREPDPWIYAVPTLAGIAKAGLIDLLLDEYGWGKLDHMHSSVYARVMKALKLKTARDHYEKQTSWQYLATLNHQWMCALDPRLSRRLVGTIYLTEADSPGAMTNYLAAWDRLGIDDTNVAEFYDLHVHADENHRDVALHEVAMPVIEAEGPRAAREIAKGIFDGRALEAAFATSEMARAEAGNAPPALAAATGTA